MSLRAAILNASPRGKRWLWGDKICFEISDSFQHSCLQGSRDSLRGKSVLILADDQLTAAAVLIELDGIASRLLACPPDVQPDHLAKIAAQARIEAIVTNSESLPVAFGPDMALIRVGPPAPSAPPHNAELDTEWLLLTSGTTGGPKIVRHTFRSLTGAILPDEWLAQPPIWSTFYDIRRYGGLQIFLRAITCGYSMVLSDSREPVTHFLARLSAHGVTHMSGTPSHWRRALMSANVDVLTLSYVRLSGEIADQKIIDRLSAVFPNASIAHAYASTEAGVGFVVNDKMEGFPTTVIGTSDLGVAIKVVDSTLRIRSPLTAVDYLGDGLPSLKDHDGYIDTGDIVERRDDRYFFAGRKQGVINVGGLKVHPEEVESVINQHPGVLMSLVKARKSPFTGSIIVAEVVTKTYDGATDQETLCSELLRKCRETLPQHKVPAVIRIVRTIKIAESGKLVRANA